MPFIFDPLSGNLIPSAVPGATPYSTFTNFPASATDGSLAIALDTHTLYTYNKGLNSWVGIATPGDVLSVGTIDSNGASANGATINSTSQLVMQSASTSVPGVVNNTTQNFSGNKTFTGTIAASNFSGTTTGSNSGDVSLGTANGLSLSSQVLSLGLASSTTTGALSSADWATFNNKQSSLTLGNLSDVGTDGITVTNGTGAVVGTGTSIAQAKASSTQNGYLSSSDWSTFNNKQSSGNYITALTGDVTATGPGSVSSTVNSVGGQTASNIASGVVAANAATNLDTVSTIVKRDSSGNFSAGSITANLFGNVTGNVSGSSSTFTGSLSGDVSGTQSATSVNKIQGTAVSSSAPTDAQILAYQSGTTSWTPVSISGDATITDSGAITVSANAISNTKLAQMAANTIKGNNTLATANPSDLTSTQVTAMLNAFVGDSGSGGTQGLVPAPASGNKAAGDFLSASGSWSYVDQSKPNYTPFSLVNQTAVGVSLAKSNNVVLYNGIDGNKQYAIVIGTAAVTIAIFDVTDQNKPVLLSTMSTLQGAYNVSVATISGAIYCFVGSSGGYNLYIVNITNPYSPSITTTFGLGSSTGSTYDIAYQNGYVYLATQSQGLKVVDVGGGLAGGTLTAPVVSYTQGGGAKSFGVAVAGNTIYTTQYSTSPYATRLINSWTLTSAGTAAVPSLLQSLTLPGVGETLGISLNSNTAFISDTTAIEQIDLVDITTPSAMTNIAQIPVPNTIAASMTAIPFGNYLFIPNGSNSTYGGRIDLYDITNRNSPVFVAYTTTGVATSSFGGIAINNGYIYAGDYGVSPGSSSNLDIFTMPDLSLVAGNVTAAHLQIPENATSGYVLTSDSSGNATWQAPSSSGTVTSVGVSVPSWLTVTGSPVTSSGTIAITGTSESANLFLASPNGSAGALTPRAIVAADLPSLSATYVTQSEVGAVSGVASLDVSGKIPVSQLPSVVMEYQQAWNPSTNTPTLQDSTGTNGYVYRINTAYNSTISGLSDPSMTNFLVGNLVIYSSSAGKWQQAPSADGVVSVNGAVGAVTVNAINQLTGDVAAGPASGSTSVTSTIQANVVSNTKLAQMAANTIKGNNTASTANASDLTTSQVAAMLPTFTSVANGTVPASGGGTTNFLRADGTWAAPSGVGTVTSVALSVPSFLSVSGSPVTSSGTLAVSLSGSALPITSGGTGATTASAAYNNISPMTTAGDIEYEASASTAARLPIGSNGQILTVVSGLPAWANAPSTGVTSVALTVPSFLSVSGSPVTSSGTLAVSLSGTPLPAANGGTGASNGGILSYGSNNLTFTTSGTTSLVLPTSGTLAVVSSGDISPTTFSIANNQSSASNITGLAFASTVKMARVQYAVVITATSNLYEAGELLLCNIGNTSWQLAATSVGNSSNVVFSITSAGQVQYTSANYSGFTSGTISFRATAL